MLELPEFSMGGMTGESDSAFMRRMITSGMIESPSYHNYHLELDGTESDSQIMLKAIKAQQNNVGQNLNDLVGRVKDVAAQAQQSNIGQQMQSMIAETIALPSTEVPSDVDEIPIVTESKRNPAAQFLVSRFGRNAESSNPVSNFL